MGGFVMNRRITAIKARESNPFANARTANNGGGYSQPEVKAHLNFFNRGFDVKLTDLDTGDFGQSYSLEVAPTTGNTDGRWDYYRRSNTLELAEEFVSEMKPMSDYRKYATALEVEAIFEEMLTIGYAIIHGEKL